MATPVLDAIWEEVNALGGDGEHPEHARALDQVLAILESYGATDPLPARIAAERAPVLIAAE